MTRRQITTVLSSLEQRENAVKDGKVIFLSNQPNGLLISVK
jgi:hypothetical protein